MLPHPPPFGRPADRKRLRRLVIHEAGHIINVLESGHLIVSVSYASGCSTIHCREPIQPAPARWSLAASSLGGLAGEARIYAVPSASGCVTDFDLLIESANILAEYERRTGMRTGPPWPQPPTPRYDLWKLAGRHLRKRDFLPRAREIADQCWARACAIIMQHQALHARVATELLDRQVLRTADFKRLRRWAAAQCTRRPG